METEDKNYLISEFEEILKKAEELKKKIDNPEPDRLLSAHRKLEEEYNSLFSEKVLLYEAAKKVIEKSFYLFVFKDKNQLGFLDSYSDSGYPRVCYAGVSGFTMPIATFQGKPLFELSPKEFMAKLIAGDYDIFR